MALLPFAPNTVWRAATTWLPLCLSALAVLFSGLQWFDAHREETLLARPLISFVLDNDTAYNTVGVKILDNGPAPAIIKRITYYVDRKATRNLDDATAKGGLSPELIRTSGFAEGSSLGVGESEWLIARSTKAKNGLDKFVEFINDRLAVGVTYCSIDNTCWEKCSGRDRCR